MTAASLCTAALAQQLSSFPGRVQKAGGSGLGHVTVRIEGAGSTLTSDSGEFTFPYSGSLKIGYPAVFHVTNWVIVKPCELKNGRTYLRDPGAEPIEILVLPPRDPRLLSAAENGPLIDCIIEEEALQMGTKSPPNPGPQSLLPAKEDGPAQELASTRDLEPRSVLAGDTGRPRLVKAAYQAATGPGPAASPAPQASGTAAPARDSFLAAKAEELGVSTEELKSAIEAWKSSVHGVYEKGLAAFDDRRYPDAIRYISESLASPQADVLENVPLAYAQYQQGLYPAAAASLRKVLAVHPGDPTVLSSLGGILQAEAHYSDAQTYLKDALAMDEQTKGTDSAAVAVDLNNLGMVYDSQGRYAEAESLLKRALAIDEKVSGPHDRVITTRLSNLAHIYGDEGKVREAVPLLERALAIDRTSRGSALTDVASDFNNLAALYLEEKKYSEAEPLFKRALEIDERELGPDHPEVGMDLNDLAVSYREQGKLDEAEPLLKRAMAIDQKALGPSHPDLARVLANLAILYRMRRKFDEAEPLLKRALAMDEKASGPNHPDVAWDLNNLGLLAYDEGKYSEAESLYLRALAIDSKTLGPNHPHLADVDENLARALHSLGEDAKANPYEEQAAKIRKQRENTIR